jgi:hypothetical protein
MGLWSPSAFRIACSVRADRSARAGSPSPAGCAFAVSTTLTPSSACDLTGASPRPLPLLGFLVRTSEIIRARPPLLPPIAPPSGLGSGRVRSPSGAAGGLAPPLTAKDWDVFGALIGNQRSALLASLDLDLALVLLSRVSPRRTRRTHVRLLPRASPPASLRPRDRSTHRSL